MNDLSTLSALMESLGLELPTPAYIAGAVLFGVVGIVAFRRGRQAKRPVTLWCGVALMLYPYVVTTTWLMYVVGLVLCAGLWVDRQRG